MQNMAAGLTIIASHNGLSTDQLPAFASLHSRAVSFRDTKLP